MKSFVLLAVFAIFFAYAYAETTCENHRKNSRTSAHGFSMNITCDASGNYLTLQCTPDSVSPKWCACFNQERQVSTMSKNIKRCECHLAKGAAEDAGKSGCDLPQCAPNGQFKLLQTNCEGKKHCVNSVTGVKTQDLADGQSCPTA